MPSVAFNAEALLAAVAGSAELAEGVVSYLASRCDSIHTLSDEIHGMAGNRFPTGCCCPTPLPMPACNRDFAKLQLESTAAGGKVPVKVDGKALHLTVGKEVFFSAAAAAGLL